MKTKTALLSVTFRQLSVSEIVKLVQSAKLDGLEWGGDVHVPPDDLANAESVRQLTQAANLSVCGYGSYYRAGENQDFAPVLATARQLSAPQIRVWAGKQGSDVAAASYRQKVVADLRRCAAMAAEFQIKVGMEYHIFTLSDTLESTCKLLFEEVAHPNFYTYWQPPEGSCPEQNLRDIAVIKDQIIGVHVFAWEKSGTAPTVRFPLAHHHAEWQRYWQALADSPVAYAGMEFVKDDAPEQFIEDAPEFLRLIK